MRALHWLMLLLLVCLAVVSHADAAEDEDVNELPARAVFAIGKGKTNGMRYMKWKILASRVKKGEFGKRLTCSITRDAAPPTLKMYNKQGEEIGVEDMTGISSVDALEMLEDYGFFPGDTSEPDPDSTAPPAAENPFLGCGARQEPPKATPVVQPTGQQQLTAAELARAAATAATAAAKAATAAAAAAEAALAALAASNTGTCQG